MFVLQFTKVDIMCNYLYNAQTWLTTKLLMLILSRTIQYYYSIIPCLYKRMNSYLVLLYYLWSNDKYIYFFLDVYFIFLIGWLYINYVGNRIRLLSSCIQFYVSAKRWGKGGVFPIYNVLWCHLYNFSRQQLSPFSPLSSDVWPYIE